MKTFTNRNAHDWQQAMAAVRQAHQDGQTTAFAGGGSDLLGQVKDRLVAPDVIVNLKTVGGQDRIEPTEGGVRIGGLTTLDAISRNALVRDRFSALAEAAESVATPQVRNVGTLAGNICQRPWCWYYRNGFPCFKAGGNTCFSLAGENQFHAILGGGPSFIVHPSDTAPALVALDARFHLVGPGGSRQMAAAEFFILPSQDPRHENILGEADLLVSVELPAPGAGTRSAYHKVMDREAWTHAIVSAAVTLHMDGDVCRAARIVLGGVAPVPWRVPDAEQVLVGQRLTSGLAAKAAELALAGAMPLSKNAYKIPLARSVVERTLMDVGARG